MGLERIARFIQRLHCAIFWLKAVDSLSPSPASLQHRRKAFLYAFKKRDPAMPQQLGCPGVTALPAEMSCNHKAVFVGTIGT